MSQVRTIKNGVAVGFETSRLIPLSSTTNNNLLRVLDLANKLSGYALSVIRTTLSKGSIKRQINTTVGVIVSPEHWETILSEADILTQNRIKFITKTDDFIIQSDNFSKSLSLTAPVQERITQKHSIILDEEEEIGFVDLGLPFVSGTLVVNGAEPTFVFPATGKLSFAEEDVGTEIEVSFVHQPIFTVIKIGRVHDGITKNQVNIGIDPRGYALHPNLAALLNISLG